MSEWGINLFCTVIEISFNAAIVGSVVCVVKRVLRHKLPPVWQYALWSLLIVKLVLPFSPQSNLSLFNLVPQNQWNSESGLTGNVNTEGNKLLSVKDNLRGEGNQLIDEGHTSSREHSKEIAESTTQVHKSQNTTQQMSKGGKLLVFIWILGMSVCSVVVSWSYKKLRRELDLKGIGERYQLDEERQSILQERLEVCRLRIGIRKQVMCSVTFAERSPALIGVLKPIINIPEKYVKEDFRQLDHILLHELAHYKRKDSIVNGIILVLQIIHWFNPVLWYCFKEMRQDMELCADDLAMAYLQPNGYRDYGLTLLEVLEAHTQENRFSTALTMANDKNYFVKRMKWIRNKELMDKKHKKVMVVGSIIILVLSTVLLTSGQIYNSFYEAQIEAEVEHIWRNSSTIKPLEDRVRGILANLPYALEALELKIDGKAPVHEVYVDYKNWKAGVPEYLQQYFFYKNAMLMMARIETIDQVVYTFREKYYSVEKYTLTYTRAHMEEHFGSALGSYGKNKKSLKELVVTLNKGIIGSYGLTQEQLSRQLGIRLYTKLGDPRYQIVLETEHGQFIGDTYYDEGNTVSNNAYVAKGKKYHTAAGAAIYWTPIEKDGSTWKGERSWIRTTIIDPKGKVVSNFENEITYKEEVYTMMNDLPQSVLVPEVFYTPENFIEERSLRGVVVACEIGEEGKGYLELEERETTTSSSIGIKNSDIARFNIQEGERIQIHMKWVGRYVEVLEVTRLD